MAEATGDAVFLFATSLQALGRAAQGDDETRTCNCTVVLIFAAFYTEANLTHIIKEMGEYKIMWQDLQGGNPGLYLKFSCFLISRSIVRGSLNRNIFTRTNSARGFIKGSLVLSK